MNYKLKIVRNKKENCKMPVFPQTAGQSKAGNDGRKTIICESRRSLDEEDHMKYVYVQKRDGEKIPGVMTKAGKIVSLSALLPEWKGRTLFDFIRDSGKMEEEIRCVSESETAEKLALSGQAIENGRLLSPIEFPAHDILCVGVNYADHLQETKEHLSGSGKLSSDNTVYFSKRACRILGPEEIVEARLDLDAKLDYEVELAVIIGRGGSGIREEEAEQHIFGYSVFNDISSRGLQTKHGQWFLGKSLDTYAAMGPVIVGREELRLPFARRISSSVNGELRQNSNTSALIHSVAEIISELSAGMTLCPGDIIATGTPSGVGMGFTPPRFMRDGDTVACEIEGIGTLQNRIRAVCRH